MRKSLYQVFKLRASEREKHAPSLSRLHFRPGLTGTQFFLFAFWKRLTPLLWLQVERVSETELHPFPGGHVVRITRNGNTMAGLEILVVQLNRASRFDGDSAAAHE